MRVCLTFYRTLAFPLIGISLICAHQVWQAQSVHFIFRVLWVKLLTSLVIASYIILFRSNQFIFFNNLGYSRSRLLAYSFVLDFSIWLLIMTMIAMMI